MTHPLFQRHRSGCAWIRIVEQANHGVLRVPCLIFTLTTDLAIFSDSLLASLCAYCLSTWKDGASGSVCNEPIPQPMRRTILSGVAGGISDADAVPGIMCTGIQISKGGRCHWSAYACKSMRRKRIHKMVHHNEHPARHPILEIGPSHVLPLRSRLLCLRSASVLRNNGGRPACPADARCVRTHPD